MIRIAIVEDSETDAGQLCACIEAWRTAHEAETMQCTVYRDAVQFLEQGGATADLVFMDIELPYKNGMDAAAEFRKYNPDAVLIFVTWATKYAVRGYAVDAIGYLVKPVGERAFSQVFEKGLRLHRERTRQQTLVLRLKDGIANVAMDRILYIEAASHQLSIVTEGETYQVWSGLDKMKEQLPAEFAACHRGYLVNLKHVDSVKKDHLCIVGKPELQIPVSRKKRTEFLNVLTEYYTRTMRG